MPLINNKDLSEIGLSEKQSFSVEQWQMNISEYAAVVEQVDTRDLKSLALTRRTSSILVSGTTKILCGMNPWG